MLFTFFFLRSSVDDSSSCGPATASLSPLSELVALRFMRGGRGGGGSMLRWLALDRRDDSLVEPPGRWVLVVTVLLAMLMQLTPFRFFGRLGRWFCKGCARYERHNTS